MQIQNILNFIQFLKNKLFRNFRIIRNAALYGNITILLLYGSDRVRSKLLVVSFLYLYVFNFMKLDGKTAQPTSVIHTLFDAYSCILTLPIVPD